MSRSEFEHDDNQPAPPRDSLLHGIVAAALVDTILSAPIALALPFVRPDNVAAAIGKLLFSVNMFVGYVGGRIAARAGMSHEDSRSQWTMATVVSGISLVVGILLQRLRFALHLVHLPPQGVPSANADNGALVELVFELSMVLLLIRFGFAMGTYSQAKREGRVTDEDEANAE